MISPVHICWLSRVEDSEQEGLSIAYEAVTETTACTHLYHRRGVSRGHFLSWVSACLRPLAISWSGRCGQEVENQHHDPDDDTA